MPTVNELMSTNISNAQVNVRSWNPVAYNVLEYKLVGGGIVDDTVALQNLVDRAIEEGRKAIYFPHGEYYVTSLSNADQVVFFGDNASFVGGYTGTIYQMGDWATNAQLADLASMGTPNESAPLGAELAFSTGWTIGTGWTGDFTNGFTHETGSTDPLTYNLGAFANSLYEVVLTVESTDPDHGFKFKITVGDSYPFEVYRGAGNEITYQNGIMAVNDGNLQIIPLTTFTGTVKDISVREIVGTIEPTTIIRDQSNASVYEARPTKEENENVFIGKDAGQYNTSGNRNVSLGNGAASMNTSGYFNTAIGYNALQNNTVGSRNIALAYAALQDNISGHRNIALGTFALNRNTHGHNNIAIGADTLWHNTTGNYNIAIGLIAQEANVTGVGNIALGYRALLENTANNYMVAIGHDAGKKLKSDSSVAIGSWAAENTTTGSDNTAIGGYALRTNVTGQRNTAIGSFAGNLSTGNNNTFIGRLAGTGLEVGSDNIFIGTGASAYATTLALHLNIGNSYYGDMGNKTFGIGVQQPTAKLHVAANTAARPSIKLDVGVLTTTKHAGGVEYDGTNLYFTKADGVRYTIDMTSFN